MASLCWLKFQWTIHFKIFRFLTLVYFPNTKILFETKWKMPLTKNCEYVGNKIFTSKKRCKKYCFLFITFFADSLYFCPNILSHIFGIQNCYLELIYIKNPNITKSWWIYENINIIFCLIRRNLLLVIVVSVEAKLE